MISTFHPGYLTGPHREPVMSPSPRMVLVGSIQLKHHDSRRMSAPTGPPGPDYSRHFEDWLVGIDGDGATEFRNAAVPHYAGRPFIRSRDGRPGLAPRNARTGDLVYLFHGGDVLFILRPLDSGRYTLVGELISCKASIVATSLA